MMWDSRKTTSLAKWKPFQCHHRLWIGKRAYYGPRYAFNMAIALLLMYFQYVILPPTVYIQSPPAQDGYSPAMYDNPDTICPPDQPTGNWPPSAILSPQSHNPPGFQYPPSGDTFRFGSMLQQSSLGEVVQQVGGFFPMADDGRDARAPMTRPTKVRPNRPKDDPGCACCVIA
ncbi:uncharacterized protein B0H18DRAFT_206771 [Fomitopsis serialis]|uniref:uncharacterized protein n=1 Tax=Fomitopsis serialis TaxID=139415 RepID=UPI002007FA8E|nr:uncharacterized protein B0H18DRAFT_206771 [Neoantrodia serialis]KAH9937718.1 hypothetical protein B0H18DRAFT_206771 [Neoantrodia serialis]